MAKKNNHAFRLFIQAAWFAVTNGYAYGFVKGKIYTGKTKDFCVPGLNCYSCPGALGSCPIGALQASLNNSQNKSAFYVLGILMLFGSIFGRFICGWLCPFGLIQDLLYKIPLFKKRKNFPCHDFFKWIKYAILAVFVILLPVVICDKAGLGQPWFCEYICPSGTLLGGIPLLIANKTLRSAAGLRFIWKVSLLLLIMIGSIKFFRPFCKYLCPLGAAYSLLNPFALHRYKIDKDKCTNCGTCHKVCKMSIKPNETPNSLECIRCGECKSSCPREAIRTYNMFAEIKKETEELSDPDNEER